MVCGVKMETCVSENTILGMTENPGLHSDNNFKLLNLQNMMRHLHYWNIPQNRLWQQLHPSLHHTGQKEGEDSQPMVSVSAKDLLKQHQKTLQQKQKERQQQMELMSAVPKIGKGLSSGQDISLDGPLKKTKLSASAELAKVKFHF